MEKNCKNCKYFRFGHCLLFRDIFENKESLKTMDYITGDGILANNLTMLLNEFNLNLEEDQKEILIEQIETVVKNTYEDNLEKEDYEIINPNKYCCSNWE